MSRGRRRKVREGMGRRRSVRDRKIVAAALKAGVCPCKSEAENPGAEHLASCPWSDPDYSEGF